MSQFEQDTGDPIGTDDQRPILSHTPDPRNQKILSSSEARPIPLDSLPLLLPTNQAKHWTKESINQASSMVSSIKFVAVAATATLALTGFASAHPGEHHATRSLAEVAQRRLFKANAHRSLKACANSAQHRALQERAAARRQAKLYELRQEQQRRRLSLDDVLNKSHKSNLTDITPSVDPSTLFGSTPQCVLEPEVTQGPYYVKGELIRNDIREEQPGIDLYAELQIIDVNTCEPVADYYFDFWHCNSTGVYSGIVAGGNGDKSDLTNINTTFHRGLAPTDENGIVQFMTKFPGHYTSRATHIHILSNHGGEVLSNNTYAGSSVSSVGQLFFDQDLITEVEKTEAYAVNKQELTTNADDGILSEETASGFDPVMQYVYLGSSVEDGVFAWISVGIDASLSKSVNPAATWTANGGVANQSSGGAGGPGGAGGQPSNGTAPGAPPSGSGSGDVGATSAPVPSCRST